MITVDNLLQNRSVITQDNSYTLEELIITRDNTLEKLVKVKVYESIDYGIAYYRNGLGYTAYVSSIEYETEIVIENFPQNVDFFRIVESDLNLIVYIFGKPFIVQSTYYSRDGQSFIHLKNRSYGNLRTDNENIQRPDR